MTVALDPLQGAISNVDLPRLKAGLGEYLGAVVDDAWQGNPLPSLLRNAERQEAARGEIVDMGMPEMGVAPVTTGPRSRVMTAEEASDKGKAMGLTFDRDVSEEEFGLLAKERQRQLANDAVFRRARNEGNYGAGKAALSVVAELFTGAVDPLNVVASFLPVVPAAGRVATTLGRLGPNLGRVARGGIEGAAGAAVLEPIVAGERAAWDPDYGFGDSLLNVAFGSALGGGLHWFGGKVIEWRRGAAAAAVEPPPAAGGAAANVPPAAPIPQRMAEAVDRTAPETRETAMRAAVAALAEDRRIEVNPVLRADPAWRVPQPETARAALDVARVPTVPANTADAIGEYKFLRDGIAGIAAMRTAELRGDQWRTPVPRDWQPDDALLGQAIRLRQGRTPERPLPEPSSLSQWLRARGGLDRNAVEAGDARAADLQRSPGLLRAKVKGSRIGDQMDYILQAALDDGFYPDLKARGEELDASRFLDDLAADAHGVRKTYREGDGDVIAWRDQQAYFTATREWIESEGIDVANMRPRDLAWLMSLDTRRQRIEVLAHRVERLTDEESLELHDRLDRELADYIAEEMAIARGSLDGAEPAKIVGEGEPLTLADLERLDAAIERSEAAGEGRGRPARQGDGAGDTGLAAPRADGAQDAGAAGREAREAGRAQPQEGGEGLERPSPAETVEALQRSASDPAADLHADPDAAARLKAEASQPQPDYREEAARLEADYAAHLTDEDRAELAAVTKPHEETIAAVEALAQCKVGGDLPSPPKGGADVV